MPATLIALLGVVTYNGPSALMLFTLSGRKSPLISSNLNEPVPLEPPATYGLCSSNTNLAVGKLPLATSIPALYPKLARIPAPDSPSFNVSMLSAIVVLVDSTVVCVPLTSRSPVITTVPLGLAAPLVVSK